MALETKTYTVQVASQKLGKVGDVVTMNDLQAKYWLLSGAIAAVETKSAKKSK